MRGEKKNVCNKTHLVLAMSGAVPQLSGVANETHQMQITKKTTITAQLANEINALQEKEKQAAVDAMTEKQAHDLFMILLKL